MVGEGLLVLQLVLPVLEVVVVEGEFHGVPIGVGEADFDGVGQADGLKGYRGEFRKELVGVLEGGFVVIEGYGVARGSLPHCGLDVIDGIVTDKEQGWLEAVTGVAVVQQGEIGSGDAALFVHIRLEVNVAVGRQAIGTAVIHHIGVAVAKGSQNNQQDAQEE